MNFDAVLLHCALAAAQCIVIGPVCSGCVCVCVYGCVCGSVTTITRIVSIDLHQTGSVSEGSDHLQLVKFWPSRAPGKWVCGGAKFFWLGLTTASAQCLRLL